jgi:outer membrane protein TolC
VGNRIIGTPFEGKDSLWDSIEDFIPHQGFDYWSVGLKLEIPLGNREAQSRYRQSRLEGMKMETEVKSLDEKISNEVIKGILDIKTTVKMKEAAKTTVDYTGESLKVEEKRYLAGESTGYDVMKIQKDLSEAKTRYLKAQVENNKAWSRLRAAEGVSLDEYEIEFNDKMM